MYKKKTEIEYVISQISNNFFIPISKIILKKNPRNLTHMKYFLSSHITRHKNNISILILVMAVGGAEDSTHF